MDIENHKRTHRIIKSFEAQVLRKRNFLAKIADFLTSMFGSFIFFLINIGFFVFWLLVNTGNVSGVAIFDPYPFVLLITFVSLEAIILSTVVLMSQNRESVTNSLREELHLQINLIAEREITKLLELNKKVLEKLGSRVTDPELDEMLKEIDASYIERELEEQINLASSQPLVKQVTKPVIKVGKAIEQTLKK